MGAEAAAAAADESGGGGSGGGVLSGVRSYVRSYVDEFRSMNKREFLHRSLALVSVVLSALMLWKGLTVWTGSESPIVVVLSGSMEPGFQRGDLLLLDNDMQRPFETGDIVVFKLKDRDVPIVHRIIHVVSKHDGGPRDQLVVTKGDNNPVDDRFLYPPGVSQLDAADIVGRVRVYIPYMGMATIVMNDYPKLKYVLLLLLGVAVLSTRES